MKTVILSLFLLLALPSYAQERYYYVGPHVDVTEDGIGTYKAPPSWAVSSVDLSSDARDLMFLVADKPQEAKGYTLLGTDPNEIIKPEAVTEWSKATGIQVEGSDHALYGLLMDALTVHADPTRANGPKPIMPTYSGDVVLNLDGDTILIDKYAQADPAYKSLVVEVVKEDYRDLRTDSLSKDSDTYLKYLSVKAAQLGVSSDSLIPADLPKEEPVKPETTIGDTFADTNGTALGSHTATGANGGWGWVAIATDHLDIDTNQLLSPNGGYGAYQADSVLSSDDMQSGGDLVSWGSNQMFGAYSRIDATNNYQYLTYNNATGTHRIFKIVSGSSSQVGSNVNGNIPSAGHSIVIVSDGSSHTGIVNGVTRIGPLTDTSITGITYAGLRLGNTSGSTTARADDFEAYDLYAVTANVPAVMNHRRQLSQ